MNENPVTPSEVDDEDARFWENEIEAAKKRSDHWYKKADVAIESYQDDEEEREYGALNILWANVETQKAALGETFGKPQVSRINANSSMRLSRHISLIWQQTISAAVKDTDDNREIRNSVHDVLLPGRGQVWLELNPITDNEGNVVWVESPLVQVMFRDYLEGPASRWGDVPWVARGHLYTLDDLMDRFKLSKAQAMLIPRKYRLPCPGTEVSDSDDNSEQFTRARVWEIWSKFPTKRRIYYAEGHQKALKVTPDPYRLRNFFPCPRPFLANGAEAWQNPLTDYSRYQDQATEIDRLSSRIFVLTETLRNCGAYDQSYPELQKLSTATDNQFIAVENWGELQQKGGLRKAIETMDLTSTIAVLDSLHKQRAELIRLTYELNGISDLVRGQTDPQETYGAQKLKATYGGHRFSARKEESRRFAAESYALKGEIIAEWYPRNQIAEMSGIAMPTIIEQRQARQSLQRMQMIMQQAQAAGMPVPQFDSYQIQELQEIANAPFTWEKIENVLRTDRRRCYMVDVETDQYRATDEDADKRLRIEFANALGQLMMQFGPMIAQNPANGTVFKQIMLFVVSSFRAGRSVEQEFEEAIDAAIQQAAQKQGQQDPKAAADAQTAQLKLQQAQIQLQKEQISLQKETVQLQQAQVEAQRAGADIQLKNVAEVNKLRQMQIKHGIEAEQAHTKAAMAQRQDNMKTAREHMKTYADQQKLRDNELKLAQKAEENMLKRERQQIENANRIEQLNFERAQRASAREVMLRDEPQRQEQN